MAFMGRGINTVRIFGNQDVSGRKIFLDNLYEGVDTIRGQAPETAQFKDIGYLDKNRKWLAGLEYANGMNKGSALTILLADSVNDSTNMATYLEIGIDGNGTTYTRAPACDINNSILTTVSINKSATGGAKLGNGLIINWGSYGTGSGSATITYSIPYTYAPKIFAGNNYNSTGAFPGFTDVGTTSCTIYKNSGINGWWFAIGY